MSRKRIEKHIKTLSEFTSTPGKGITRLSYSNEDLLARNYIKEKMEDYGLNVREDGLGNIFGKLEGKLKDAPSVIVGSHFDSVPNGGAYDGAAGVIAGLEVAALFFENKIVPRYPLEIVALIEEEGSRFGGGLMGSRGISGLLTEEDFKKLKDKNGISAVEAMYKINLNPCLPKSRNPLTMKAFLELHIEQGPILEEKKTPIGVVEAIVGLAQLEVTIVGQAGHAGTTPMDRRSDALVTAAKIIAMLPGLVTNELEGTVITTGRMHVYPNGANVIPEKTVFSIDIRSSKEESIKNVISKVHEIIQSYNGNGIMIAIEQSLFIQPKELNNKIRSILEQKSKELSIPYCSINSGAGHDAMILSDMTDAGMIFIPSRAGLSHCPEEWSDIKHLLYGVQILYETAKYLTEVDSLES